MRFSPPPAPGTALFPSLFSSLTFFFQKTADGGWEEEGGVGGRVGWVADVNAGVYFGAGVRSQCFAGACARGVAMAHRLHIADLQTWADVQMAGAFRESVFFLLPPQQPLSRSSPLRPRLPPSVIYPGSLIIYEPNRPESHRLPSSASPTNTTMSRWRK